MSAILGVFRSEEPGGPDGAVAAMLDRMRRRGADRREVWHGEGATLAIQRHEWELDPGMGNPGLLAAAADLVVAADATLYYRDDLRRRLRARGIESRGTAPAELIADAYRAWGIRCAGELEGEFAFILWDRRLRRVLCSRDFLAKRPLYYTDLGSTLVVASSLNGLVAHPEVPRDLDLASIAAAAVGMHAAGPETCYRAVRVLPGATDLSWQPGRFHPLRRHWEPTVEPSSRLSFEDAAGELRGLIERAVEERLAPAAPTTVWMSGGCDSPAVFGAGQSALRRSPGSRSLLPVSISYPEGDPGREDELIAAIGRYWQVPIHWLDIEQIPFFDPGGRVPEREEPFRHLFEHWCRALAGGTRTLGSRVALDGNGGDQVFQVSPVYLADLLASGRWSELRRDWRAMGGRGVGSFVRHVVAPLAPLPPLPLHRMVSGLGRGRHRTHYMERWVPSWLRTSFRQGNSLLERERACLPRGRWGAHAAAESAWYWESAFVQRALAQLTGIGLECGVEIRSPLADRRVVQFGLSRPRAERASRSESKRLLRAALGGLLPESVLAPRTTRTGTTDGFSHRHVSTHLPGLFEELFRRPLVLAELGMVDPQRLRDAVREYRHRGQAQLRVALCYTYHAEQWIREHAGAPAGDRRVILSGASAAA